VNYGGDTETQLHNARLLAEQAKYATYTKYGVPVIYAGNQDCRAEVERIFRDNQVDIRLTENVMPEVNTYQIEVVNEIIRELFQTVIIRGKGFDVAEEYMSEKFIPTPRAAFRGINLLARGYDDQPGLGSIMALDIGGATTDFYSNVLDNPLYVYPGDDHTKRLKRTILKTPNTPLAYRRVEGKYGLSYNAENVKEIPRFQNGHMARDLNHFLSEKFSGITLDPNDSFSQFVHPTSWGITWIWPATWIGCRLIRWTCRPRASRTPPGPSWPRKSWPSPPSATPAMWKKPKPTLCSTASISSTSRSQPCLSAAPFITR
jgi:hypothetical protein